MLLLIAFAPTYIIIIINLTSVQDVTGMTWVRVRVGRGVGVWLGLDISQYLLAIQEK